MKCPYCNTEMELGYIQCRDGVSWNNKKSKIATFASSNLNAISLASDHGIFSGSSAVAYNCRKCKKIMIDYREDNTDRNSDL